MVIGSRLCAVIPGVVLALVAFCPNMRHPLRIAYLLFVRALALVAWASMCRHGYNRISSTIYARIPTQWVGCVNCRPSRWSIPVLGMSHAVTTACWAAVVCPMARAPTTSSPGLNRICSNGSPVIAIAHRPCRTSKPIHALIWRISLSIGLFSPRPTCRKLPGVPLTKPLTYNPVCVLPTTRRECFSCRDLWYLYKYLISQPIFIIFLFFIILDWRRDLSVGKLTKWRSGFSTAVRCPTDTLRTRWYTLPYGLSTGLAGLFWKNIHSFMMNKFDK